MKPIQSLIQKAHDKGLLRYAPPNLPWHVDQEVYQFELGRTSMSGVEFGYDLWLDKITWAVQSIDGAELEPDEFLQELQRAVGVEEKTSTVFKEYKQLLEGALKELQTFGAGHSVDIDFIVEEAAKAHLETLENPSESTFFYLADENTLEVKVTDEGIIVDAYAQSGQQHVGTEARLATDWWDALTTDLRQCDDCGYMEDAGGSLDWTNGSCSECDPDIIKDPENQRRITGNREDQPCQHCEDTSDFWDKKRELYAQKRAIVDEEPEVTSHNDEPKTKRFIVSQITTVDAVDEDEALELVVNNIKGGNQELVEQLVETELKRYEVGDVNRYWAEDEEHAIEQFKNDRLNTGDPNFIKEVE